MSPIYDYSCPKCEKEFEEYRSFSDSDKKTKCPRCGQRADRLISLPNTSKDLAYNFVDTNTTKNPIQFNSKGQWKKHLKTLGLTDDIPQTPPKHGSLKQLKSEPSKAERIEGHKKVIEGVLREKGAIR